MNGIFVSFPSLRRWQPFGIGLAVPKKKRTYKTVLLWVTMKNMESEKEVPSVRS
jgi:hypothetical protein